MYNALDLLKEELENARKTFGGTVADVRQEQLHKDPGGMALPLGAVYAHLIFSEDAIIHGMLQGKPSLSQTTYMDKTGVNPAMPPMDEKWHDAHKHWAKNVKINLSDLRDYEKAVYRDTDIYLDHLTEKDLQKKVDLGTWGKMTIAFLIYSYIIGHTNSLAGEISALKGIQGVKGYPF